MLSVWFLSVVPVQAMPWDVLGDTGMCWAEFASQQCPKFVCPWGILEGIPFISQKSCAVSKHLLFSLFVTFQSKSLLGAPLKIQKTTENIDGAASKGNIRKTITFLSGTLK